MSQSVPPAVPSPGLTPVPVVGVVCFRGDEVLLIRRGRPPRLGEWSIPGGRVEWGEGVRETALRELFEETGVRAELVALVDVVDGLFAEAQRHYVMIDYVAHWRSGDPVAGDDASEAVFVSLAEAMERVAWPATRQVIRDGARMMGLNMSAM